MSDQLEQDNHDSSGQDESTFEGPASVTGNEHPDGIVGPERPLPDDAPEVDDEQTAEDLDASGVDLGNPTSEPRDFIVSVDGNTVTVEVEGVDDDDVEPKTIDGMSEDELSQLAMRVAEQRATLASRARVARPFEHADKESLLVLQNQIQTELAYR